MSANGQEIEASPKKGWADFPESQSKESNSWSNVALWFPNRVLDLMDIFRVDFGIGGSTGGVLRATKYAQMGYRYINPGSLRVGLLGRRAPMLWETSGDKGVGSYFQASKQREVCAGEIGFGLDLLGGAYMGICFDEVIDFFGGFVSSDFKHDDIKY